MEAPEGLAALTMPVMPAFKGLAGGRGGCHSGSICGLSSTHTIRGQSSGCTGSQSVSSGTTSMAWAGSRGCNNVSEGRRLMGAAGRQPAPAPPAQRPQTPDCAAEPVQSAATCGPKPLGPRGSRHLRWPAGAQLPGAPGLQSVANNVFTTCEDRID